MTNADLARAERHKPAGMPYTSQAVRALCAEQPAMTRFLSHCHRRTYPTNAVLVKPETLSFLLRGYAYDCMDDETGGEEIVLAYLDEGDFFGELGLFSESHRRLTWVRTRTRCEVAEISYDKLRSLTVECPEIIHAIHAQLARRLVGTNRKVSDMTFADVTGRIATS